MKQKPVFLAALLVFALGCQFLGSGATQPPEPAASATKESQPAAATPALAHTLAPTITFAPTLAPPTPTPNADYPYVAVRGKATVFSDISQQFSDDHARHLELVWNHFAGMFAQSRGDRIEIHYAMSEEKFYKALERCPTTVIPGARMLTACYDEIARWYIIPYQTPDYGTQLHEIGHDFLYAVFPESEDFPWFKEGSAMYYEGGVFDSEGRLSVDPPAEYCTILFRRYYADGTLLPLETVLTMPREPFLADPTHTYSQSCMFFFYMMKNHEPVMREVYRQINDRSIRDNATLLAHLRAATGMDFAQLEKAYLEFGLKY